MKRFFFVLFLFFVVVGISSVTLLFSKNEQQESKVPTQKKTVVFIPGLDLVPSDYLTITDNLTKNGYTIIPYTPTYKNTENYSEMVDVWTSDISMLAGEKEIIVIGHSVGGAVATHFCTQDKRCIAGINMDGSPAYDKTISVPFLYLQAEAGIYCTPSCIDGRTRMENITKASKTEIVTISKIKHYNFTDRRDAALYEQGYLGEIDGLDNINGEIIAFLETL